MITRGYALSIIISSTTSEYISQDSNAIFLSIGKKEDDGSWNWRTAKIKDTEAAEIIRVVTGQIDTASFYHTYNGNATKIWINRKDDSVHFRIDDHAKALNPGEQIVLRIMLKESIRNSLGAQNPHNSNSRSKLTVQTESRPTFRNLST